MKKVIAIVAGGYSLSMMSLCVVQKGFCLSWTTKNMIATLSI